MRALDEKYKRRVVCTSKGSLYQYQKSKLKSYVVALLMYISVLVKQFAVFLHEFCNGNLRLCLKFYIQTLRRVILQGGKCIVFDLHPSTWHFLMDYIFADLGGPFSLCVRNFLMFSVGGNYINWLIRKGERTLRFVLIIQ